MCGMLVVVARDPHIAFLAQAPPAYAVNPNAILDKHAAGDHIHRARWSLLSEQRALMEHTMPADRETISVVALDSQEPLSSVWQPLARNCVPMASTMLQGPQVLNVVAPDTLDPLLSVRQPLAPNCAPTEHTMQRAPRVLNVVAPVPAMSM